MKFGFAIALLFLQITVFAQPYKYIDSSKISATEKYWQQIKFQPEKALVDIEAAIPGIALDIRYATNNNFTGKQIYKQAKAFARQPVVQALKQVQDELKTKGLGLKIYDAYRPYNITVKFYEIAKDTTFVADPRKGSRHNRGCAIDLTLIDLKTGKELDMPTAYDSFNKEAAADYPNIPPGKIFNRKLLRRVMERNGFKIYPSEWWHFDFVGWEQFDLLDVPFEDL